MNANELRIGNWIHCPLHVIQPEGLYGNFQVEGWQINAMAQFERTAKRWVDWQPVILTEMWLTEFGFENKSNWAESWFWKGSFGINKHAGKLHWNDLSNSRQLDYVHQLQNLYYALTGEELTLIEQEPQSQQ